MNAICTMGAADAALSLPGADTARDLAATSISPNTKRAYGAALAALRGMAGRRRPRRWHAGGTAASRDTAAGSGWRAS